VARYIRQSPTFLLVSSFSTANTVHNTSASWTESKEEIMGIRNCDD